MLGLFYHPRAIHDVFTCPYLGVGTGGQTPIKSLAPKCHKMLGFNPPPGPKIAFKCTISLLYFNYFTSLDLLHIPPTKHSLLHS